MKPPKEDVDRGYAWLVLAACFTIEFLYGLLICSVGVLTPAFLEEIDNDLVKVSWIGSTLLGTFTMCGPFVGSIEGRLGHRLASFLGGIMILVGLTSASFCRTVTGLILTFGVITGLGCGLAANVSGVAPGDYFNKRLPVAYGICMSGGALGLLAVGPLTFFLLEVYTLSGTLLILGAIGFHVCLAGALLRPSSTLMLEIAVSEDDTAGCVDVPQGPANCVDVPGVSAECRDAPQEPADCVDVPQGPAECVDVPQGPAECKDAPQQPADCVDVPQRPVECVDVPQGPAYCVDVPQRPVECVDVPQGPAECVDVPQEPAECGNAPQGCVDCVDVPQRPVECVDVPQGPAYCVDVPQRPVECVDVPQGPAECVDVPQEPAECGNAPQGCVDCVDVPQRPGECVGVPQGPAECRDAPQEPADCVDVPQEPADCVDAQQAPADCVHAPQRLEVCVDAQQGPEDLCAQSETIVTLSHGHIFSPTDNNDDTEARSHYPGTSKGDNSGAENAAVAPLLEQNSPSSKTHSRCRTIRESVVLYGANGFFLYLLSALFWSLSEATCMVHLPNYAELKGSTPAQSASLFTGMGITALFSGMLSGLASSDKAIGSILLHVGFEGMSGVSVMLLPVLSHTYYLQMVACVLYGIYSQGPYTLVSPICIELIGRSKLAVAYGMWSFVLGIGLLCGPPIASLIYENSGDYDYTFIFAGCCNLTSAVFAMCIPLFKKDI